MSGWVVHGRAFPSSTPAFTWQTQSLYGPPKISSCRFGSSLVPLMGICNVGGQTTRATRSVSHPSRSMWPLAFQKWQTPLWYHPLTHFVSPASKSPTCSETLWSGKCSKECDVVDYPSWKWGTKLFLYILNFRLQAGSFCRYSLGHYFVLLLTWHIQFILFHHNWEQGLSRSGLQEAKETL